MLYKFKNIAKLLLVIPLLTATFSCKKICTNQENTTPPFNLDVILSSQGKNFISFGSLKFRQNSSTAHIINIGVRVFNLSPNRFYLLQRAVNPITDSTGCSSNAWLTLGKGLKSATIYTDALGNGQTALWRDVSSITPGTSFHIHFQVIDSASLKTVLMSDCYDYTVR